MSTQQPPCKRRKIMHNHSHDPHQTPQTNNAYLDELQRIQEQSKQWKQYIQCHLPPLPTINIHGPALPQNDTTTHATVLPELEKENQRLLKNQIRMEEQIKSLTLENNKLKICVRALAQIVKEGPRPQKHLVPMSKTNPWSQEVDKIKTKLNTYFEKRYKSLEVDIEPAQHHLDNAWIDDTALRRRIQNHIVVNGINNSKTGQQSKILIKKVGNKNSHDHSVCADIFGVNDCFKMNLLDYVEAFQIPRGHRIPSLEGKIGLRCKRFIPKGTVLGQYIGTEYIAKEFDTIYEHSNEWDLRNMYAFDLNLYIPSDLDDENNIKENPSYYQTATKRELIIDGWDQRKINPLIYINDCRQNIDEDTPSKQDEAFWNCSFRTVVINGWPSVFVLAKGDVNVGEAFNIFYGDNYGVSINKMDSHQLLMARLGGLVDDTVLKMLGIDKNMPDVYILDM
eukprot:105136_1